MLNCPYVRVQINTIGRIPDAKAIRIKDRKETRMLREVQRAMNAA
jgi:hypothetical protein